MLNRGFLITESFSCGLLNMQGNTYFSAVWSTLAPDKSVSWERLLCWGRDLSVSRQSFHATSIESAQFALWWRWLSDCLPTHKTHKVVWKEQLVVCSVRGGTSNVRVLLGTPLYPPSLHCDGHMFVLLFQSPEMDNFHVISGVVSLIV